MALTITLPDSRPVELHDGPVLHAYPPHSDVSLCGRVKALEPTARATEYCPQCVRAAGQKQFVGR